MYECTYKISRFGRSGNAATGTDVSMLFPKFLPKEKRSEVNQERLCLVGAGVGVGVQGVMKKIAKFPL
jgi:hypothetical protein